MEQRIEVPAVCPQCDGHVCVEWDHSDPASSRVHCMSQDSETTWTGCTFTELLAVDINADSWRIYPRSN